MRIFLIRLSSLGDVILCTPIIKALHRSFPSAYTSAVVNPRFVELLKWNPNLKEVIPFKLTSLGRIIRGADVTIDLQSKPKTVLISLLSGARRRIGYAGRFSSFYTDPVLDEEGKHVVECHASLLKPLGIDPDPIPPVEVYIPAQFKERAVWELRRRGIEGGIRLGLFPGAGWSSKMWAKERFSEIGRRAVDQFGVYVLVFGGPSERGLAGEVASLIGQNAYPFEGLNLVELASLISTCHLFVSNDTGPMHLAAGVGVPTLGLFGPTDPRRFSPWASGCKAIKGDVPCSPCRSFRNCNGRRCMDSISVEEVWRWVEGKCEGVLRGS